MGTVSQPVRYGVRFVVMAAALLSLASPCVAGELAEPIVLRDHVGTVSAIVFSPDGKMLATGDGKFGEGSGVVRVWEVPTWARLDGIFKHQNKITALAFSKDGKYFATASLAEFLRPPELYIRDTQEYRVETALDNDVFATWCVAFSPDGKMLASGHESADVKLWDVANRELIVTLKGHSHRVRSVAFSPDGKSLASGSTDGTIKLWNALSRDEIASLKEEGFYVKCIAFSPDGAHLAAGGGAYDENTKKWTTGSVRLWDVATGKIASKTTSHSQTVRSILFEPHGTWLVSVSGSGVGEGGELPGELRFSNPADGTERMLVKLPFGISSLALSPDEKFLAAGCDDGAARVWDVSGFRKAK